MADKEQKSLQEMEEIKDERIKESGQLVLDENKQKNGMEDAGSKKNTKRAAGGGCCGGSCNGACGCHG